MSESYTDEELVWLVRNKARRLMATIARLQRERDEARRVARSVARMWMTFLLNGTLPDPAPDVDTALAYPEPEGVVQSQAASSATPA